MILTGQNDVVVPLVSALADAVFEHEMVQALGCMRDKQLVGGVVYSNANKASCEMTVAGLYPGWLTREFLMASFHYPFCQLELIKVLGLVRSDNQRALDFDHKLGFTLETKVTDVYGHGIDCIIMSMRREECKWLPAAEKWFSKLAA